MSNNTKEIILRYSVATIGLFLVAFGAALSAKSNLGIAPLSCVAYVLNLKFSSISFGAFAALNNLAYMLIQIVLLRKNFKLRNLMQIIPSILFGYMLDLSMLIIGGWEVEILLGRLGLIIAASAITALGISIEVAANAWMFSAEMTVAALASINKKPFKTNKIFMDSSLVVLSAVLCFIFFKNPFGLEYSSILNILLAKDQGVAIGIGTLVLAFLPSVFMRLTDKPIEKFVNSVVKSVKK